MVIGNISKSYKLREMGDRWSKVRSLWTFSYPKLDLSGNFQMKRDFRFNFANSLMCECVICSWLRVLLSPVFRLCHPLLPLSWPWPLTLSLSLVPPSPSPGSTSSRPPQRRSPCRSNRLDAYVVFPPSPIPQHLALSLSRPAQTFSWWSKNCGFFLHSFSFLPSQIPYPHFSCSFSSTIFHFSLVLLCSFTHFSISSPAYPSVFSHRLCSCAQPGILISTIGQRETIITLQGL